MASLKGNIILNGINTATSVIFPVITFPYAARILLPEGIGTINFFNSIIGYIILLTSLGIPLYAVKEVAKHRDNKEKRDNVTIEIIILSTILCIVGYLIVWVLATFVPEISSQATLFYVLSLSIIFTTIGVNWFYQAIEDFKFITIRAIIIRTLAAAALFIFVHKPSELLIYGFITVGSTVGNNIINFIHLRKHIDIKFVSFKNLEIGRHVKPSFQIFILNLIISLYIQLNSIMLGFISGDESVGYFTAGTKISHIGLTLIASIGTVLLPRCSNLIQKGDLEGFSNVIQKSIKITQILSYPMTIGLIILAVPITIIFCGSDYYESIPVVILNAPVIIFISLTNIMGIQILYPMDKTNYVIYSVAVGAILNIVLNLVLIPSMQATGAAIATLVAEFGVLMCQMRLGRNFFPFKLSFLFNIKYGLLAILMGSIIYLSTFWMQHYWLMLVVGVPLGVIIYVFLLFLTKDSFILEMKEIIATRFIRK